MPFTHFWPQDSLRQWWGTQKSDLGQIRVGTEGLGKNRLARADHQFAERADGGNMSRQYEAG